MQSSLRKIAWSSIVDRVPGDGHHYVESEMTFERHAIGQTWAGFQDTHVGVTFTLGVGNHKRHQTRGSSSADTVPTKASLYKTLNSGQ